MLDLVQVLHAHLIREFDEDVMNSGCHERKTLEKMTAYVRPHSLKELENRIFGGLLWMNSALKVLLFQTL